MEGHEPDVSKDVQSPPRIGGDVDEGVRVQPNGFLLELSTDWIILRASENSHKFFGEYPARLVDEALARFTLAQSLHDLRNLLSRQSGNSGRARAYRMRLVDGADHCDVAFQLKPGRILLEGVPSLNEGFGSYYGSIGRLGFDMRDREVQPLLDSAARRLRALTGYDHARISLSSGEQAESCRSGFTACEPVEGTGALPAFVCSSSAQPVQLFPRKPDDRGSESALFRALSDAQLARLKKNGVGSLLSVSFDDGDGLSGQIECQSRTSREPNLELHAATELFGQIVALNLRQMR